MKVFIHQPSQLQCALLHFNLTRSFICFEISLIYKINECYHFYSKAVCKQNGTLIWYCRNAWFFLFREEHSAWKLAMSATEVQTGNDLARLCKVFLKRLRGPLNTFHENWIVIGEVYTLVIVTKQCDIRDLWYITPGEQMGRTESITQFRSSALINKHSVFLIRWTNCIKLGIVRTRNWWFGRTRRAVRLEIISKKLFRLICYGWGGGG